MRVAELIRAMCQIVEFRDRYSQLQDIPADLTRRGGTTPCSPVGAGNAVTSDIQHRVTVRLKIFGSEVFPGDKPSNHMHHNHSRSGDRMIPPNLRRDPVGLYSLNPAFAMVY